MPRTTSMQKRWASEPVQIETPPDARLLAGWIGGAQGELPEAKWENWWHNRVDEALHEVEATGAPKWFADVPYQPLALARSSGKTWICRIANTGIDPASASNAGQWAEHIDPTLLLPRRSFAKNDYIRIPDVPGGLIIQWGETQPALNLTIGNTSVSVTFPVAFPNACMQVATNTRGTLLAMSSAFSAGAASKTGFAGYLENSRSDQAVVGSYIAVGF